MATATLNSTVTTTTAPCGDQQWFTTTGAYVNLDSRLTTSTLTYADTSGNWSIEESPLEKQELLDYINFLHKFLGIPFSIEDWKKMDKKERSAVLRDKSIDDILDE